jgi:hypothetical protein
MAKKKLFASVFIFYRLFSTEIPLNVGIATPISESNFGDGISSHTCVLSKAGVYYLSKALIISETLDDEPLIRITSSGVTLDLNGNVLSAKMKKSGNCLIEIAEGVSWVTVRNGMLYNSTGEGIKILSDTSNVFLKNLCIRKVVGSAVYATKCSSLKIKAIMMCNILPSDKSGCVGISMQDCSNILVSDVQISSETLTTDFTALKLVSCLVGNCDTIRIVSNEMQAKTSFYGVYLEYCKSIQFSQAEIISNFSEKDFYGFYLNGCEGVVLDKIKIQDCGAIYTCIGCKTIDGRFNSLTNSFLQGNYTILDSVYGVFCNNEKYSLLERNNILLNISPNVGSAYGIKLGLDNDEKTWGADIVVNENYISGNTGFAHSYGYYDSSTSIGKIFTNNISKSHGSVFEFGSTRVSKKDHMNYWASILLTNPTQILREITFDGMDILSIEKKGINLSVVDN